MAARKKTTSKKATVTRRTVTKKEQSNSIFDYFRFGESYTSLILGVVVVIVAFILLIAFVRNRNLAGIEDIDQDISATQTQQEQTAVPGSTYTVKAGDDLWGIAEDAYGSGYNWVDIAEANNLANAGVIEEGMKLQIPDIEAREQTALDQQPTTTPEEDVSPTVIAEKPDQEKITAEDSKEDTTDQKVTGDSYTVKEGDYLWSIAERAYGDGYKWVDIARANSITNPDLIYPDTKLVLPR